MPDYADPTIALNGRWQPPTTQAMQQPAMNMLNMVGNAQQIQQQQQAIQAQNKLRELYSSPGATDDSGQLKPDALKQVYSIDPQVGMAIQRNQFAMQQADMKMKMLSSQQFQDQMKDAYKVKTDARLAYEEAMNKGMTPEQARQAGQQTLTEGLQQLKESGAYPKAWVDKFNPQFDPNSGGIDQAQYLQYQKTLEDIKLKHADIGIKAGSLAERQRSDLERERLQQQKLDVENPNFNIDTSPKSGQPGQAQGGGQQMGAQSTQASATPSGAPPIAPSGMPGGDAHGPEYLQGLKPEIGTQVKALAEGRMQFPSSFALKSPYWQKMIQAVSQYDPSFDAVNYNARAKTRADFTSGTGAKNITSFNTAIGHLGRLLQSADALDNSGFRAYNTVKNWVNKETGDPKIITFENDKQAVVDELTRAFRGSGGSVHDITGWEAKINSSNSPAQLHAAVKEAVELLDSRIDAVGEQYKRGMGTTADVRDMLTPSAKETLAKLSGEKAAKQEYKDAESVRLAYESKKISKDEALRMLRDQFGMQ